MALPALLDRRRGRGLALVAGLTLVQAAALGAAAFATRSLFEAMHLGTALPGRDLAVLVAAGAVVAATRVAARHVGEWIGQDYARQIRAALFTQAARMPARAVAHRRAGYMSLRFVGDMTAFRNWLGLGLPRLITVCVLIPATLSVLYLLDPIFVVAVLPVVAGTTILIGWGGVRLVPLQRRLRMRRARIAADMAERMPIAPHLDRLGRRKTELALLDKHTVSMISATLRHRDRAETLRALPDLASGLAAALVISMGHKTGVGPGTIAGALAALGLLMAPLRDLGGVWNHRAAFEAAAVKATAVLSRATRQVYSTGAALPKGPPDVRFNAVALPSGQVLTREVTAGDRTQLGISPFDAEVVMEMLLGLETPPVGQILLSGVDLRALSRGSLRRGVVRIGPLPDVLHGSLRRALTMACTRRPDDETLLAMAQAEGLGPLIARLGGLDGTVSEGARNLTRSETLAIGLVRLHLLRPRLILIDGSVDKPTRARVNAYLARRKATVISA